MQSKEILLDDTIFRIVKEQIGDLDIDEAIALHHDYQEDDSTKVCPCCDAKVDEEDLLYLPNNGFDDENACPHCENILSHSDLVKPEFTLWLDINSWSMATKKIIIGTLQSEERRDKEPVTIRVIDATNDITERDKVMQNYDKLRSAFTEVPNTVYDSEPLTEEDKEVLDFIKQVSFVIAMFFIAFFIAYQILMHANMDQT